MRSARWIGGRNKQVIGIKDRTRWGRFAGALAAVLYLCALHFLFNWVQYGDDQDARPDWVVSAGVALLAVYMTLVAVNRAWIATEAFVNTVQFLALLGGFVTFYYAFLPDYKIKSALESRDEAISERDKARKERDTYQSQARIGKKAAEAAEERVREAERKRNASEAEMRAATDAASVAQVRELAALATLKATSDELTNTRSILTTSQVSSLRVRQDLRHNVLDFLHYEVAQRCNILSTSADQCLKVLLSRDDLWYVLTKRDKTVFAETFPKFWQDTQAERAKLTREDLAKIEKTSDCENRQSDHVEQCKRKLARELSYRAGQDGDVIVNRGIVKTAMGPYVKMLRDRASCEYLSEKQIPPNWPEDCL